MMTTPEGRRRLGAVNTVAMFKFMDDSSGAFQCTREWMGERNDISPTAPQKPYSFHGVSTEPCPAVTATGSNDCISSYGPLAGRSKPGVTTDGTRLSTEQWALYTDDYTVTISRYPNHPSQRRVRFARHSAGSPDEVSNFQLWDQEVNARLHCSDWQEPQAVSGLSLDTALLSFLGMDNSNGVALRHWAVTPMNETSLEIAVVHYYDTADDHTPYMMTQGDQSAELKFTEFSDGLPKPKVDAWLSEQFAGHDILNISCATETPTSGLNVPLITTGLEEAPRVVDFYADNIDGSVAPSQTDLPTSYTAYWGAMTYDHRLARKTQRGSNELSLSKPIQNLTQDLITVADVRNMFIAEGLYEGESCVASDTLCVSGFTRGNSSSCTSTAGACFYDAGPPEICDPVDTVACSVYLPGDASSCTSCASGGCTSTGCTYTPGSAPSYDVAHGFWTSQASVASISVDDYLDSMLQVSGLSVAELHAPDSVASGRRRVQDPVANLVTATVTAAAQLETPWTSPYVLAGNSVFGIMSACLKTNDPRDSGTGAPAPGSFMSRAQEPFIAGLLTTPTLFLEGKSGASTQWDMKFPESMPCQHVDPAVCCRSAVSSPVQCLDRTPAYGKWFCENTGHSWNADASVCSSGSFDTKEGCEKTNHTWVKDPCKHNPLCPVPGHFWQPFVDMGVDFAEMIGVSATMSVRAAGVKMPKVVTMAKTCRKYEMIDKCPSCGRTWWGLPKICRYCPSSRFVRECKTWNDQTFSWSDAEQRERAAAFEADGVAIKKDCNIWQAQCDTSDKIRIPKDTWGDSLQGGCQYMNVLSASLNLVGSGNPKFLSDRFWRLPAGAINVDTWEPGLTASLTTYKCEAHHDDTAPAVKAVLIEADLNPQVNLSLCVSTKEVFRNLKASFGEHSWLADVDIDRLEDWTLAVEAVIDAGVSSGATAKIDLLDLDAVDTSMHTRGYGRFRSGDPSTGCTCAGNTIATGAQCSFDTRADATMTAKLYSTRPGAKILEEKPQSLQMKVRILILVVLVCTSHAPCATTHTNQGIDIWCCGACLQMDWCFNMVAVVNMMGIATSSPAIPDAGCMLNGTLPIGFPFDADKAHKRISSVAGMDPFKAMKMGMEWWTKFMTKANVPTGSLAKPNATAGESSGL